MNPSLSLAGLREQRAELLGQIGAVEDFRPGSLVGRYRRCGKPTCHCAQEGDRGHGPSWSLTRGVKGKTVTKIVGPDAVEATREQIRRYHEMQRLLHQFTEVNVKICDELLDTESHDLDGQHRVEKGGSAEN